MIPSLTDVIAEAIRPYITHADIMSGDLSSCSSEVLQAIDQAGFAVVPKEPTEDMVHAAMDKLDTPFYDDLEIAYRAMLSASKEG